VATTIAVGVNGEVRCEMLGMATGTSGAEPFWTAFLRSLSRRGLHGVKLVISGAHEGLKAAVAKLLKASWQRCRGHFLRNALAYADKGQRQKVFALINTIFAQETADTAHEQWRVVSDQLRPELPKLAGMMDDAEHEVLTFIDFPKEHRVKIHGTNVLERLNGEIKRPADVVGIFPNEASIRRLVGALLMEQSDEYAIQKRYMSLESLTTMSKNPPISLPAGPALA
jgi:transposase-like protein